MIDIYIVLGLIVIGYCVGQFLEKRHYRSIVEREQKLMGLPMTSSKRPIGQLTDPTQVKLVDGACVISVDYFKRFVAGLRMFFGGNVRSYETLVDRARREAVLRLQESCSDADQIINLRIETSSITKGQKGQVGAIEVHAYATAVYL